MRLIFGFNFVLFLFNIIFYLYFKIILWMCIKCFEIKLNVFLDSFFMNWEVGNLE